MADFPVAPIDQDTLLTVSLLRFNPETRVQSIGEDRLVVKNLSAATYLVVDREQRRILERFRDTASVPRVLFGLIGERRCPPLRDYYELILKAVRAGILSSPGVAGPDPLPAAEWRFKLRASIARGFSLVCMGVSALLLVLHPPALPTRPWHLLAGWLGLCLAQSLGAFLAACVLRGGECEVYSPRFLWRSAFPRFTLSRRDALLLGKDGEAALALVRVAPFFLFAALACRFSPALSMIFVCGVLYHLCPFHRGALVDLLVVFYRDPRLDTNHRFFFVPNQAFDSIVRDRFRLTDRRFVLQVAGYTLAWLLLVMVSSVALLKLNAWELARRFHEAGGLRFTACLVGGLLAVIVLAGLGFAVWLIAHQAREALEPWLRRRAARRMAAAVLSDSAVRDCLARTHLFKDLPPADMAGLASATNTRWLAKGEVVLRQGERGDTMFVVFSGTAEVLREQEVGRPEFIAELLPCDVFGEVALLEGGPRTRTVRASSDLCLLVIERDAFHALVLNRFSREHIATAVQKKAFLSRIAFSRRWSPAAMLAFARRSRFFDFEAGRKLIREGDDNQFFYLVHEGSLEVTLRDKPVARLGRGDFFGELSLLQNNVAGASVLARTPGRCLVLNKRDFLEFITRDFLVGLDMEQIASRRLGRAVFPAVTSAAGFDEMAAR